MLKIFQIVSVNIRAILIGLAATSVIGTGLFIRGCQYGEERMDTKWRSQIAISKPREVGRDTIIQSIPQRPREGRAKAVPVPPEVSPIGETVDSVKAQAPRKLIIRTLEIGKLEVTYFPDLDEFFWHHEPPPLKLVKVEIQTERIVLAPCSTWERIQDMAIGGIIVGGLVYLGTQITK